jgi:sec-independent protein translocase protein TatA
MFRNPLTDSIVALVVLLLIFGPKRLPQLGRSLGQGIKEFKNSIGGQSSEGPDEQPALLPAQTSATSPAVTQSQATSEQ